MSLNIIDYKILKFIKKHPYCSKQDILNHFNPKESTEYRFENLLNPQAPTPSYIEQKSDLHWERGNLIGQDYDAYFLTPFGETALADYKADINSKKFHTFKHSFLYPILSAIITAYITTKFLTK